ncbi:GAP family protein [Demequina mangrovi]|uniref:Sap, sulfolipid-1-addressing protein n=1 Tax=Demequina mangrovi TaxID=1043493 RepID=A0A1H6Z3E6_9MICO|nr:GAP family protein [Demequina mangrovi]SEJ48113.1 Sap, sulfolipid-1-addressing protein [Demequina mangrovi]
MGAVIGGVLPLAVGVAISPIPIIAAILMLLSPQARVTGVGFLLGWVLGILVATTAFIALSGSYTEGTGESVAAVGIAQLTLGALLLLLAARSWRARPAAGEEAPLPSWMGAIDRFTLPRALAFGFLMSGVNPKNLLLCASAGISIGAGATDTMPTGTTAVALVVFTVLAASTVAVPVIAYLAAAERMRGPLDTLRAWLAANNALIMAVLLLVLGVEMLGKGLGQL